MTQEVKEELHKKIFQNCLLAIGVMLFLCLMDVIFLYAKPETLQLAFSLFPMLFIGITIVIFEVAYRKDKGSMALVGIELLVFSILLLYFPQIYANLDRKFCAQLTFLPIFCGIYYTAKNIILYAKTQKHYQNNLSDVKQIRNEE